jgi:hypothetical protein
MKTKDILAKIKADPAAEFALRPGPHAWDFAKVRRLRSLGNGRWAYGEHKPRGRAEWLRGPSDSSVRSRNLVDVATVEAEFEERAKHRAGLQAEYRRANRVVDRLRAIGVPATSTGKRITIFDLADWERILALAERS